MGNSIDRNISVCLAYYNGGKYISDQVDSVLRQLKASDELLIVDDCSSDGGLLQIAELKDARVKIIFNEKNIGLVATFNRAIKYSKNDLILLCDQDDLWVDGRVDVLFNELLRFKKGLVSGNQMHFRNGNSSDLLLPVYKILNCDSDNKIKNIIEIILGKSSYFGCCMAIDRRVLCKIAFPFPRYIESHDLWLAMVANYLNVNRHIEDVVTYRRIHMENVSLRKRSIFKKIKGKIVHVISILEICRRSIFIRL